MNTHLASSWKSTCPINLLPYFALLVQKSETSIHSGFLESCLNWEKLGNDFSHVSPAKVMKRLLRFRNVTNLFYIFVPFCYLFHYNYYYLSPFVPDLLRFLILFLTLILYLFLTYSQIHAAFCDFQAVRAILIEAIFLKLERRQFFKFLKGSYLFENGPSWWSVSGAEFENFSWHSWSIHFGRMNLTHDISYSTNQHSSLYGHCKQFCNREEARGFQSYVFKFWKDSVCSN